MGPNISHSLLLSQMRKHFGEDICNIEGMPEFLNAVDQAYQEADSHRELLERSISLTSEELLGHNTVLRTRQARLRQFNEVVLDLAKMIADGEAEQAELFDKIILGLAKPLGVYRASIWLFSEGESSLYCAAQYDPLALNRLADKKLCRSSFESFLTEMEGQRFLATRSPVNDPRVQELVEHGLAQSATKGILCSAIRKGTTLLGLVYCDHLEASRNWTEEEGGFVASVSDLLSLAVESGLRRQAELERSSLEANLHQAQRLESIGMLAGGVAHDLNNLLTPILGNAQLGLIGLSEKENYYQEFSEIRHAASAARDLVAQLLALASKQLREPQAVCLNETIERTSKLMTRLVPAPVDLSMHLAEDLPAIKADPSQLNQVLVNLLVNATDAIEGVGAIAIQTFLVKHDDAAFVGLEIRDNGSGMDADTAQQIFDPFFTTKMVGRDAGRGVGLGLATVYSIIAQHGGTIRVQSQLGEGTTFRIELPSTTDSPANKRVEPKVDLTSQQTEMSILVVEDEPAVLRLVSKILRKQGYTVFPTETPSAAIKFVKTHLGRVDLILTDVVLPEMNGRVLREKLRSRLSCPVLYMSGHARDILGDGALDPNTPFLRKPFKMDDLLGKVREVMA